MHISGMVMESGVSEWQKLVNGFLFLVYSFAGLFLWYSAKDAIGLWWYRFRHGSQPHKCPHCNQYVRWGTTGNEQGGLQRC